MKILCWNIAGIRASLKRRDFDFLINSEYDVICIQETKATREQGEKALSDNLKDKYSWRIWNSTKGTTQRKGFSGTCIWSRERPIKIIDPPSLDEEGRVVAMEFEKCIVVNVYTPNSQDITSERCLYRIGVWDEVFRDYFNKLNQIKPTIVCGDFNVANEHIDIWGEEERHDGKTCVGFLDGERYNFKKHLELGYVDAFRYLNSEGDNYTYWDQRMPWLRKQNKGWRIDYFLVPEKISKNIKSCKIHKDILGSDHCPITLDISFPRKLKLVKSL